MSARDLGEYISNEQRNIKEANNTDFKPTYQEELSKFANEATIQNERAKKLIDEIGLLESSKIRHFAITQGVSPYDVDDLVKITQLHGRDFMVGPRWLSYLDEYNEVAQVFR